MASSTGAPLLDPRTWVDRAIGHAVDARRATGVATSTTDARRAGQLVGELGGQPRRALTDGEARQAAYLMTTTALARHTMVVPPPATAAAEQAVAELLWSATVWLWEQLRADERVGACRTPPAAHPPTVDAVSGRRARRRRRGWR